MTQKIETTGKLELLHLQEFETDIFNLVDKWRRRLEKYDYSWHTMAVISNNLLSIEEAHKWVKNDVDHTEIVDDDTRDE